MPRNLRGDGALSVDQQEQVIEMVKTGATLPTRRQAVHRQPKHRRRRLGPLRRTRAAVQPTTLGQRLDALHAQLDRVLAETTGVGRIPEPEPEPRR